MEIFIMCLIWLFVICAGLILMRPDRDCEVEDRLREIEDEYYGVIRDD